MPGLDIGPAGEARRRRGWDLDFTRGRHLIDGRACDDLDGWLAAVGATFERAGPAYGETADGGLVAFAADRPRATDAGLWLEAAGENRLLDAAFEGSGAWALFNCISAAAPGAAPDGGTAARRLTVTADGPALAAQSVIGPAPGAGLIFCLYVRAGASATPANAFGLYNSTTAQNLLFVRIDLTTGALTYAVGTTGAAVSPGPAGWWRLTLTVTGGVAEGDGLSVYPGLPGGVCTAGTDVDVWGPQLARAGAAGSPILTGASPGARAADRMDLPLPDRARRIRATWGAGQVTELVRAELPDPDVLDLAGDWPWRGRALRRLEVTP
jgi:hypothetical protein